MGKPATSDARVPLAITPQRELEQFPQRLQGENRWHAAWRNAPGMGGEGGSARHGGLRD